MSPTTLAWIVFSLYAVVTAGLAFRGMTKTTDLRGFALGNGDLGPVITGITLAAAIASTATFVINPGFVWAHGVAAMMHLGVATFGGVLLGLALLSRGFRKHGANALTLPHWIGVRYGHRGMRTFFAVLNLVLAISFVVLIVKGSALVMQHTLHIGYLPALIIIVGFVFSYVLMGGTYAHVYTNAMQGALMVAVAIAIVLSGVHLLSDGVGPFLERVAGGDPNLIALVNPDSSLFNTPWSVYACGVIVGFGLVAQPHILTKSLYLKSDSQLRSYLIIGGVVCVIYTTVLVAGLYARATGIAIPSQDAVMAVYLKSAFSPLVGVLISVALLAAGMSTLDGILVSASTIAANDIFLGALGDRLLSGRSPGDREAIAFRASRWILVAMGIVSFVVALDPPKLVGIFAQVGIYGLVASSLAPIALGVLTTSVDARLVFIGAVVGPLVHFAHYGTVVYGMGETLNPAVSATSGIIASFAVIGLASMARRFVPRSRAASARLEEQTP